MHPAMLNYLAASAGGAKGFTGSSVGQILFVVALAVSIWVFGPRLFRRA